MAIYADSYYTTEVTSDSVRRPWNNTIFPGNYVAHLNAYRDQNVQAFPGINFFRAVGAYVVPSNTTEIAAGNYTCKILSPDLRQDDKPRQDKDFILRAGDATTGGGGITVYRTSVNVVNLSGGSDSTITTNPTALGGVTLGDLETSATGVFPMSGAFSPFNGLSGTAITSDQAVGVTVDGTTLAKINPSQEAAILVEVCFYANAPAPDADDLHLPFPTESGQSEQ
jgi:hypothetical protein